MVYFTYFVLDNSANLLNPSLLFNKIKIKKIYKLTLRVLTMKNVIAKIFSGEIDEEVHSDFVKFSRGVFENRYLLEGKKQKDRWGVKTSAEFANFFVRKCLEKFGGKFDFKGAIICTANIKEDIEFEIAGVKSY